jgi:hypothetical protein
VRRVGSDHFPTRPFRKSQNQQPSVGGSTGSQVGTLNETIRVLQPADEVAV